MLVEVDKTLRVD